jgi:DNA-binding transcriptional LysR family regulator
VAFVWFRKFFNDAEMSDGLAGISVFVEAAEAGSFANAASRLNLTRSAVGKTVARLERRLGARLFHRTTRSQSLTTEGQAFYERCLRGLAEIRAGEAMLESGRQEAAGRLRVTLPVLFGRRCVAPILTELARRHPKLELELSFSDRPVDLIEEGFDLAVRNGALGDGANLTARRIALQRMTVCAAPAYLAARGTPRSIEELQELDMIVYGRSGSRRRWLFPRPEGGATEVVPRSRLCFDDLEAIADAAVAGLGLAWLPCWLIRDRALAGELVPILAKASRLVLESYAVWPQTPRLPLRVRLAIDALAAELPRSTEV